MRTQLLRWNIQSLLMSKICVTRIYWFKSNFYVIFYSLQAQGQQRWQTKSISTLLAWFSFLDFRRGGEGGGGREQCFVAWSWGGGDLKNHFYCSKIKHPCFSIWVMKLNFVSFIFCFSPTYFLEQIPDGRSKCQFKNEDKCQIWGDD